MKKERRKRRTKEEIEDLINNAAIELIESGGFSNLTVRNISERAKIEPVVFYNRYLNVEEFIDEFVRKYDYWLTETTKVESGENDIDDFISILKNLFDSLKDNIIMQQLLRWELYEENEITSRTAKLREFHTLPLVDKYLKKFKDAPFEIEVLSAIIISGLYYLVLHSRLTPFARLDINTEKGQNQIYRALDNLGHFLFDSNCKVNDKSLEIAKVMKRKGLHADLIVECTQIPINILKKL